MRYLKISPTAQRWACAFGVGLLLIAGVAGDALSGDKPLRLAQNQTVTPPNPSPIPSTRLSPSQVSAPCISNCNSAYALCANQCPVAGTLSQIQPDINVSQTIQGNRVDIIQNQQPVQCRLNCTTQQQSCWATCR